MTHSGPDLCKRETLSSYEQMQPQRKELNSFSKDWYTNVSLRKVKIKC